MTTLRQDELSQFDFALDGVGFMLASPEEGEASYRLVAPDLAYERQDQSVELTENKLDTLYWGSNRSWHDGQGQARLDVPDVSSEFAYLSSLGVAVDTKGEARLLRSASTKHAGSTTYGALVEMQGRLFFVHNSTSLRRFDSLSAAAVTITVADAVTDLATDGGYVYMAMQSHGVHRVNATDVTDTHWSDARAIVLGWAKARMYAIDTAAGVAPYRLVELAAGAGSSVKYTFPDSEVPRAIVELGNHVYIPATHGRGSQVYAYDGTTTFPALRLPRGDLCLGMVPFAGTSALLFCGRYAASGSEVEEMVVYLVSQLSTGHLAIENGGRPLVTLNAGSSANGYSSHIAAFEGLEWKGLVFFGWHEQSGKPGLMAYNPQTGGLFRHVYATDGSVTYQMRGVTEWQGRLSFVGNNTLYVEDATYVTSGEIVSSAIDLNVDTNKLWLVQETGFSPLPDGTSVTHEYSTDGGTTWTGSATASTVGAELLRSARSVVSRQIQHRVTLTANSAKTATPVLRKAGIGGWPASKPLGEHRLLVSAFPNQRTRAQTLDERSAGWDVFSAFKTRRDAGAVYEYQPPWFRFDTTALRVRVAHVETLGPWGATGARIGGYLAVTLKEVP